MVWPFGCLLGTEGAWSFYDGSQVPAKGGRVWILNGNGEQFLCIPHKPSARRSWWHGMMMPCLPGRPSLHSPPLILSHSFVFRRDL
jgi:hypothetical protein